MIKTDKNAGKVAEFLLQIKAIEIKPQNPFTWASGLKSPIYCDNRKVLSYPNIRTFIRQQFVTMIEDNFGKPEVIAGVATGGIPLGALVAQELGISFVYVRSSSKSHGLNNRIEGVCTPGQSVVVIEDLISTGGSSLDAVKALREQGMEVRGMGAIFSYGFDIAKKNFEEASLDLVTLSDYPSLLQVAQDLEYINKSDLDLLQTWRNNPSEWSNNFLTAQ